MKLRKLVVSFTIAVAVCNAGYPSIVPSSSTVLAASVPSAYETIKDKYPETIEKWKSADPTLRDSEIEAFMMALTNEVKSKGEVTKENLNENFKQAFYSVMPSHLKAVLAAMKGFGVTMENVQNKQVPEGLDHLKEAVKLELLGIPLSSANPGGGSNTSKEMEKQPAGSTTQPAPVTGTDIKQSVEEDKLVSTLPDIIGHWAEHDMVTMAKKGVLKGNQGKALPNDKITRAQFTAFLVQLLELKEQAGTRLTFQDIDAEKWYYQPLSLAFQAGLINGYNETQIGPDDYITREQMSVLLVNAAKYAGVESSEQKEVTFTDGEKISSWASHSVFAAHSMGMIQGFKDGSFQSQEHATRAQALVMLSRLAEKLSTK